MNPDTEILFPSRVIPGLRDLRGAAWRNLVGEVQPLAEDSADKLAFILMMVRINGCANCESDSFRAMRGCTACATQTVEKHPDSDQELLRTYKQCQTEIENRMNVIRSKV